MSDFIMDGFNYDAMARSMTRDDLYAELGLAIYGSEDEEFNDAGGIGPQTVATVRACVAELERRGDYVGLDRFYEVRRRGGYIPQYRPSAVEVEWPDARGRYAPWQPSRAN